MVMANSAFCRECRRRVPADHVIRDGRVFLHAECPYCGPSDTMLSSDVAAWQRKRDIVGYDPARATTCAMNCDRCNVSHSPNIAFVDVTNRCNMMCPICIANIRGMGFEFHPPLEYFDKLFAGLGKLHPIPLAELFGGEPTVRDDLLDIINIARKHGVKTRVVTNGIRLADEAYCKKLCEAGVRFRIAIDGRDPEIYNRMRRNPGACQKKMKALENLKKYSRRKNAILCCAARKINEDHIGDLLQCCHDHAAVIDSIGLLPLTEVWDEGTFESDVQTTREDVEHMIERSVPGGQVEFIPAGVMDCLRQARRFFKAKSSSDALMFGGVHPDCETMTLLVSDGKEYRSINQFLRLPVTRVVEDMLALSRRIEPELAGLDPEKRRERWRGKWLLIKTFAPLAMKAVSWRRLVRGNPLATLPRMLGGLLIGRRGSDLARKHLNMSVLLRVAVLPFEETHAIDSARLSKCKAVFAYEDVDTGTIRTVPACTWAGIYRNTILQKINAAYSAPAEGPGPGPHAESLPPAVLPQPEGTARSRAQPLSGASSRAV